MTDEELAREQRIAAAEARQQKAYEQGGTVEERMERMAALKAEILNDEPAETEPPK